MDLDNSIYYGTISADMQLLETTDGVSLEDLWKEHLSLLNVYNGKLFLLGRFLGYTTTKPEADKVAQTRTRWQRGGEHVQANQRSRSQRDIAVATAMEFFQNELDYTRLAELLVLDAATIKSAIGSIIEEDAIWRFQMLLRQFYNNKPRIMEDALTNAQVTVMPFYYGAGDLRVPPMVAGRTFTAGHQHFFRTATENVVTETELDMLVGTVAHHGYGTKLFISGNSDTMDKVLDLDDDIIGKFYARNEYAPDDAVTINQPSIYMQISVGINEQFRAVGVYKGKATLLINDDEPDGYLRCWSYQGDNSPNNPLVIREPDQANMRGILAIRGSVYPFEQAHYERYWTSAPRKYGNGAVLQVGHHNGSGYVAPTWADDDAI